LALLTSKEHLNVKELSRYTPRYLADVTQLTGRPYTVTLAHASLNLGHSLSENKNIGHRPHVMGYVRLCHFPHFYYLRFLQWRMEKNVLFLAFSAYFSRFFLQILLQLQNFYQKSKCTHHARTRRHPYAKFDVLKPSQSWDIAWRKTDQPTIHTAYFAIRGPREPQRCAEGFALDGFLNYLHIARVEMYRPNNIIT